MKYMVEEIFGPDVAEKMGDFWTLDKEGEIKGAFKPCGRESLYKSARQGFNWRWDVIDPALWYLGGTQGHARYYSRFVALQVKAALLGTPLEVYEKTPKGIRS
jgi:phosphoribosylaminoimidazole carboxylase (NCAIR synthetase)